MRKVVYDGFAFTDLRLKAPTFVFKMYVGHLI